MEPNLQVHGEAEAGVGRYRLLVGSRKWDNVWSSISRLLSGEQAEL